MKNGSKNFLVGNQRGTLSVHIDFGYQSAYVAGYKAGQEDALRSETEPASRCISCGAEECNCWRDIMEGKK